MQNRSTGDQPGGRPSPINVVDEARMPPATDAAIRRLLCDCFPADVAVFSRTRHWHGCAPLFSVVLGAGDRVVGHVGVIARTVQWGGGQVPVAGVQNVAVHPDLRGRGCGALLMSHAMAEAAHRGIPFGLLFCLPRLEKFYGALGWVTVADPVVMADANGHGVPSSDQSICMVLPLSAAAPPRGLIDLQGRDW